MGMLTLPSAGRFDTWPPASDAAVAAWYPADVYLMLVRDRQVLFVRQADTGTWMLPSSGLRARETVAEGACRAALEQVNVCIELSNVYLVDVRYHDDGAGVRAALYARARRFRGVPVVSDLRVHDGLAWYSPSRLPEPTAPHVATAMSTWDEQALFGEHGSTMPCSGASGPCRKDGHPDRPLSATTGSAHPYGCADDLAFRAEKLLCDARDLLGEDGRR